MTFDRFNQLWNALVRDRIYPKATIASKGMSDATATALSEYADGNKRTIEETLCRISAGDIQLFSEETEGFVQLCKHH